MILQAHKTNEMIAKVEEFAAKDDHYMVELYLKQNHLIIFFEGLRYLGRKDQILKDFKNDPDYYTHYIHGARMPMLETLRFEGRLHEGKQLHALDHLTFV